jgi:hypothetical protein
MSSAQYRLVASTVMLDGVCAEASIVGVPPVSGAFMIVPDDVLQ